MNNVGNLVIEGARIIFKNFSGKEDDFNRDGKRTFGVIIPDPEQAEMLERDGWNVKYRKQGDENEPPVAWIKVRARFDRFPPKVVMITQRNKTVMNADSIGSLDYADIKNADISISPYPYQANGKEGIAAYLKTLYVTIEEDEFASKYAEEEAPEEMPFK